MQHRNSILVVSWAGFCLPWLAMSLAATPNAFQITGGSTVSIFDTGSLQETGVIGFPLGAVTRMALSPDGESVFLAGGYYVTPAQANVSTGLLTKVFNVLAYQGLLGPIAVSPDGKTLYVAALGSAYPEVFVIDVTSGQVTATVEDTELSNAFTPVQSALSADGNTLVVLNKESGRKSGALAVMNIPALAFRSNIKAPAPFYGPFVLTPNGKNVYAVTGNTGTGIVEIDVETGATLANLPVHAGALALSADGSTLYAANSSLEVIDTATNQVIQQIPLPPTMYRPNSVLAVNSIENTAYYSYTDSSGKAFVDVIDLTGTSNPRSFGVAASVGAMAVSANGDSLFVGYNAANLVSALDYTAGRVVGWIELPGEPLLAAGSYHAIAVSPDGHRVFIPFYNYRPSLPGLAVADASTLRVVNSAVFDGRTPLSVAVAPDGATVYVATSLPTDASTDIEAFDASSLALKAVLPVNNVDDFIPSRDGRFLFVTLGPSVAKVDASTGQTVASVAMPSGFESSALALSPSGATLYIGTAPLAQAPLSIQVVATDSFSQTSALPFCGIHLALSRDGKTLYSDGCGGYGGDAVYAIDISTSTVLDTTTLPLSYNTNLAATPDGKQLWVSGESSTTGTFGIVSFDLAAGTSAVIPSYSGGMVAFAGGN